MSRLTPDRGMLYLCDLGDGIAFRWTCEDSNTWQRILADLKLTLPHWTGRRYSAQSKLWFVPRHGWSALDRWIDAWFTLAARTWIEDERGEPAGPRSRHNAVVTLDEAYQTLHLLPTAPAEVVAAAHRAMVKLSHPDAGGSHEAAVAVNAAMALIRDAPGRGH